MSRTVPDAGRRRVLFGVYPARAVKIFVIGAGQVGSTIVEALHGEHDVTVIDLDPARLASLATATTSPRSRPTAPAAARSPTQASATPTS